MSGRLSSCSVVQEENLVHRMCKTPRTPIKTACQITPRKSESKRCLFRSNSPTGSDDLGLMSPMSNSSCTSTKSINSPQFSPNGTFTTPPRTPTRCSPRISSKKVGVKSSLFPDLNLVTPKSRRTPPKTPKTPKALLSKMLTPQSKVDSVEDIEEGIRSLSTPSTSRSLRRKQSFESNIVAESPSVNSVSQDSDEESSAQKFKEPTKLGLRPISCESFYGPVSQPLKAKTKLFIDTIDFRAGTKELVRSSSKDSLTSNRSFVNGGSHKKKRASDGSVRSRRSRSSHGEKRKAPHVGVWHNIKKPKQMKKITKIEKPLISPKSRVSKMLKSPKSNEIKVKSKPFLQENPRKRIAHSKKRRRSDSEHGDIIDSFPDHLIKRKKLPTSGVNSHPALKDKRAETPEKLTPDPNKKFLKYGPTRKAVFTLTDNVKLQISDGVMKLQTPKKRRKLYSGKKDVVEDFNDFEEVDKEMQESIEGILSRLQNDKDTNGELRNNRQVEKQAYETQLLHNAENQKITIGNTSPLKSISKSPRSPLRTVSNLQTLIVNDFESDDNESGPAAASQEKNPSEMSLAKTGTIVSYLTNILVNNDHTTGESFTNVEGETENLPPDEGGKYYSVFYKENWNKSLALNDSCNVKIHTSRKKTFVPDDQYLLDAGQKSVGIVTCKKCGVMYQAGDFADEATHNNFHNHLPELRFTGWNNERVVGKYLDGRVIMIVSADPKIWWQKVSKILEIVDQELGFPKASAQSLYYKTVYLYINEKTKQIAGCLIAEECKVAYKMFPPLEGVEIDSCSKDPSPCKVGISRIWTALSHRRKGVASRMIECLRRTYLFGEIVSLDQIAFSVPSPSGRLSSCSVVQEENLVHRMCKTPRTPIKTACQITPRKSESKRCLFRSNSPTGSDDLGLMSPMSASSCTSTQSINSPQFSPNGTFTTPPRTPTRCSPRISSKKVGVKSSLFPDLNLVTPKSRRTPPKTPKTPKALLSKMLTPQSKVDSVEDIEEGIRSLSTPSTSRSLRRKQSFESNIVAESPSVNSVSQDSDEESSAQKFKEPTKLGLRPISCESFYGPVSQPLKAKTKLFIDTIDFRAGKKELVRSSSKDSLTSNRSFVNGGSHKKKRASDGSVRSRRSRSSHGEKRKAPHVGVWHNIKKPKQMKKITKIEKPLISPKSRVSKMLKSPKSKEIKVKSKPFLQENPRKRIAHSKKRRRSDSEYGDIIDSFPDHLIKRKKLPTSGVNSHPALKDKRAETPEKLTPDPNKKFLKYGHTRKAVFTLTDNVKLQISDGVMKLQTPKKRRKLYSGKKDVVEDFNDFEEVDKEMQESIEGILSRLQNDKDTNGELRNNRQVEKQAYETQLLHNAENQKITIGNISPLKSISKSPRSPLRTVSNLQTLIVNDFESDDNESGPAAASQEKSPSEMSLAKTGTIVSYLTNILVNNDHTTSESFTNVEGETENLPPDEGGKYYSVFYKENWNKSLALNESCNVKIHTSKKKTFVPDDQYLLDAGQKSVGIVTCKKCGVMYQAGDFADEATHNNFHNHLPELRFTGWNNERVVGKYLDGRVIMIVSADPKIWWQKVSKILEIVDQELGFPEASAQSLYYKTVYLYINEKTKQIAGCLIAEECKVAYKMFPPLEGVEIDSCSKDPSPCKVGISRIWTALSHRRKGVASRMIECLRRTYLFGEIVSLDQIAFSVPSPSGKLLAQKVTGKFDFLVYGFA